MIVAEYGSVEIESCAVCGGVWLDKGELEAIVGCPSPKKDKPDSDLGPPELDCPICVGKLARDRYGRTEVVVDKCPHGDGTWLDAGELEQIIAAYRSSSGEPEDHDEHGARALAGFFNVSREKPDTAKE
jgi:Zn-finger nucleic acid-binding protein